MKIVELDLMTEWLNRAISHYEEDEHDHAEICIRIADAFGNLAHERMHSTELELETERHRVEVTKRSRAQVRMSGSETQD